MKILVTGGTGFIGANLCRYFAAEGHSVVAFDNLSRSGAENNLTWLRSKSSRNFSFVKGDILKRSELKEAMRGADVVLHCASQTAVTLSVLDPVTDFEINARGTLNLLETVREVAPLAIVGYTSTNKVYGEMSGIAVVRNGDRYSYRSKPRGISEEQPLDFHSPYGCSKGTADQYVRDYARIYGLKTFVFRQSCIYGAMQYGSEDQGWVAHFLRSAMANRAITIYGDGAQVRDVLYIDDLVEAFRLAIHKADQIRGEVFNIGGGPGNTLSLLELVQWMRDKLNYQGEVKFARERPGDQRVYVSDIDRAKDRLGWAPKVSPPEGLQRLVEWYRANLAGHAVT